MYKVLLYSILIRIGSYHQGEDLNMKCSSSSPSLRNDLAILTDALREGERERGHGEQALKPDSERCWGQKVAVAP